MLVHHCTSNSCNQGNIPLDLELSPKARTDIDNPCIQQESCILLQREEIRTEDHNHKE